MPPTATLEEIKAYQKKLEKNEITPHRLPPCPRCRVDSAFFQLYAYRDRRFLVLVGAVVQAVFSALARFKCPGCGKTFTYYPDFAIPYKHFTRQTIMGFARSYVESEDKTYEQSLMVEHSVPGYPDPPQIHPEGAKAMAPSTIHRWITTLGRWGHTAQKALNLILQENPASSLCRDLIQLSIPRRKYRSPFRKHCLLRCLRLHRIEASFQATFHTSIFTKLAIGCSFS